MKNLMTKAARVGLTAVIIAGAAGMILTLNPPKESSQDEGLTLVNEGHADIVTSRLAERTSTQKFSAALEKMGHEPPRVYDFNGNTVYFSTREVMNKTPDELLQEYQHEFVLQGINSKQYLIPALAHELRRSDSDGPPSEELMEMYEAAANGEILPQLVESNYMSMGGAEYAHTSEQKGAPIEQTMSQRTAKLERYGEKFRTAYIACGGDSTYFDIEVSRAVEAEGEMQQAAAKMGMALEKREPTTCAGGVCSEEQDAYASVSRKMDAMKRIFEADQSLLYCPQINTLLQEVADESVAQFEAKVRAVRQIEAFYDKKTGSSAVTAMWSDEDFDLALASSQDLPDSAARTSAFGKCDGCKRTLAFKGNGAEGKYASDVLRVKSQPVEVIEHYVEDLGRKGWKLSELHDTIGQVYKSQGTSIPEDSRWMHFSRGTQHLTIHVKFDKETGMTTLTSNTTD